MKQNNTSHSHVGHLTRVQKFMRQIQLNFQIHFHKFRYTTVVFATSLHMYL